MNYFSYGLSYILYTTGIELSSFEFIAWIVNKMHFEFWYIMHLGKSNDRIYIMIGKI